jgi:hypothetical protein
MTTRTCPASTCWPAATRTSATTPSAEAVSRCSIFIASMVSSACPMATGSPAATRTSTTLQDLNLHVARRLHAALEEDAVVAECGAWLAPRRSDGLGQPGALADDPHPPPATASRGLDQCRQAHRGHRALQLFGRACGEGPVARYVSAPACPSSATATSASPT